MGSRRIVLALEGLPFNAAQWAALKAAIEPDTLVRVRDDDDDALAGALAVAEIALIPKDLDERHLASGTLRWVHCNHSGLTRSARPEVFARKLIVTGAAGRSAGELAEHAMMFALLLSSRYSEIYDAQRRQEWRRPDPASLARPLTGQTLAIIGLGHTGLALARRARAFDMQVVGFRRRNQAAPGLVDRVYSTEAGDRIETALEIADFVALVLSLSDASHHLIDKARLAAMKRTAFLINMSRGGIVDHEALLAALRDGTIAGAGLDVTTPEPLPPGHPLWEAPNVLITPHFSATRVDMSQRSLEIIVDNLRRYRAGHTMLNQLRANDVYSQPR